MLSLFGNAGHAGPHDILFTTFLTLLGALVAPFFYMVAHRLLAYQQREYENFLDESEGRPQRHISKFAILHDPDMPERRFSLLLPFTYLLQKSGTRTSKARLRILAEFATPILFGYHAWQAGCTLFGFAGFVLISALIVLTLTDAFAQLLPDDITLPLLWSGLLLNTFGVFNSVESAVYGAAAGFLFLWGMYWCFKLCTGREGMGWGDFKLMAALGAWFGWQAVPVLMMYSAIPGIFYGVVLKLRSGSANRHFAFGPFLAIAAVFLLFGAPTDVYTLFAHMFV